MKQLTAIAVFLALGMTASAGITPFEHQLPAQAVKTTPAAILAQQPAVKESFTTQPKAQKRTPGQATTNFFAFIKAVGNTALHIPTILFSDVQGGATITPPSFWFRLDFRSAPTAAKPTK